MNLTVDDTAALQKLGAKVTVNPWKTPPVPKSPEKSDAEKTMGMIVTLLENLPDAMAAAVKGQPAPVVTVNVPKANVTVQAPDINFPEQVAPNITVQAPSDYPRESAPTVWNVEITKRDANNRIKTFTLRAEK